MIACISLIKKELPWATIEVRMESAFFSDETITLPSEMDIAFTLSALFERFAELMGLIESRQSRRNINGVWSYFESNWSPIKWDREFRFIFIRQKCKEMYKGAIQLDLFVPHEYGYEFKVIVINKNDSKESADVP